MGRFCVSGFVAVALFVSGCDPFGEVTFQFRVTDAQSEEPIAGACVATDELSFASRSFIEQGPTDSDGEVSAVHLMVLNWRNLKPSFLPMVVRVNDGETEETIVVQFETGATGEGTDFNVELVSFEVRTGDLEFSTPRGCGD